MTAENKPTPDELFRMKQKEMSDADLIENVQNQLSELCKTGGRSFTMRVPPSVNDFDMLVCEMARRFKEYASQSTPTVPAYVEVLASEELPDGTKARVSWFFTNKSVGGFGFDDKKGFRLEDKFSKDYKHIKWLKPVPAPSKDKREIASEAWDACKRYATFDKDALGNPIPNKEQYLNSIL